MILSITNDIVDVQNVVVLTIVKAVVLDAFGRFGKDSSRIEIGRVEKVGVHLVVKGQESRGQAFHNLSQISHLVVYIAKEALVRKSLDGVHPGQEAVGFDLESVARRGPRGSPRSAVPRWRRER